MDNELRDLALGDVAALQAALETIRRAATGAQPAHVERAWDQAHRALGALERRLELLHQDDAGPAPGA